MRQKVILRRRLIGPLRWPQYLPFGAILPPAFPGDVIPEELTAIIQQHNHNQDDPSWGTVEDLKIKVAESDISVTLHFSYVCKSDCLYGGRRRQGDVVHLGELRVARRAVEVFTLAVCVVDIVHGPDHDIPRGPFFLFQVKSGRVAATGVAPFCETFAIA